MKSQKELKEMHREILEREVWKDARMVKYCVDKTAYIVELDNGDILPIEKPKMETRFCFGYSDSRCDTEDYDRANEAADHASKSQTYFKQQNLKDINRTIESLAGKKPSRYVFCLSAPYTGQPKDSQLKDLRQVDPYRCNTPPEKITTENLARIIDGCKIVRQDFAKRIDAYLKRYGMSKVHTWSYWRDE